MATMIEKIEFTSIYPTTDVDVAATTTATFLIDTIVDRL